MRTLLIVSTLVFLACIVLFLGDMAFLPHPVLTMLVSAEIAVGMFFALQVKEESRPWRDVATAVTVLFALVCLTIFLSSVWA